MSTNTGELSISPAQSLDQSIRDFPCSSRTCCTCGCVYTSMPLFRQSTVCFRCNHRMCERCTEVFSVNEHRALGLHETTDEARTVSPKPQYTSNPTSIPPLLPPYRPPAPLPPLCPPPPSPPAVTDSDQLQNSNGHGDPDIQGKARNQMDNRNEQGMQSHREDPKEQHSTPILGRKKRKLNMVKCQRCREDKKGCTWKSLEKCDRCIEKGLLCSQGTRVARPKKLTPRHPSPIHKNVSPSVDSASFEDRLKKWIFLKSYHKMMNTAMNQLNRLEKRVECHFDWSYTLPKRGPRKDFREFVLVDLPKALEESHRGLITTENGLGALARRSLGAGESVVSLIGFLDMLCPECSPRSLKPMVNQAMESLDAPGAFMVQQHLLQTHFYLFNPDEDKNAKDLQIRETARYAKFKVEIPRQAEEILESLGFFRAATYSRSLNLCPLNIEYLCDIEWSPQPLDCLGRTPLHRYLDNELEWDCWLLRELEGLHDSDFIDASWWNCQDLLGRTPLHIMFQFADLDEFPGELEKILEIGANPGLSTIHGYTLLHYAAVKGRLEICKLLTGDTVACDIGAVDEMGYTALDYAVIKKHEAVVSLLFRLYEKFGLDAKMRKALQIQKEIEEGVFFL